MKLFAAGFNAHHQLSSFSHAAPSKAESATGAADDIHTFAEVYEAELIRFVDAFWSASIVDVGGRGALLRGAPDFSTSIGPKWEHTRGKIVSTALTADSLLLVYEDVPARTDPTRPRSGFKIVSLCSTSEPLYISCHSTTHVAHRLNSSLVAAVNVAWPESTNNGSGCVIYECREGSSHNFRDFIRWIATEGDQIRAKDQNEESSMIHESGLVRRRHALRTACVSLQASATTFVLLGANGEVYTWGDARFPQCLGRDGDPGRPLPVDELTGLKVRKVATSSGGTRCLALTEAGDVYAWGPAELVASIGYEESAARSSGKTDDEADWMRLGSTPPLQLEGWVQRVVLPIIEGGEDASVVDIAVGDHHALLLEEKTGLWVCGRNSNGQLGSVPPGEVTPWLRHPAFCDAKRVVEVGAGDLNSFVVATASAVGEDVTGRDTTHTRTAIFQERVETV